MSYNIMYTFQTQPTKLVVERIKNHIFEISSFDYHIHYSSTHQPLMSSFISFCFLKVKLININSMKLKNCRDGKCLCIEIELMHLGFRRNSAIGVHCYNRLIDITTCVCILTLFSRVSFECKFQVLLRLSIMHICKQTNNS